MNGLSLVHDLITTLEPNAMAWGTSAHFLWSGAQPFELHRPATNLLSSDCFKYFPSAFASVHAMPGHGSGLESLVFLKYTHRFMLLVRVVMAVVCGETL